MKSQLCRLPPHIYHLDRNLSSAALMQETTSQLHPPAAGPGTIEMDSLDEISSSADPHPSLDDEAAPSQPAQSSVARMSCSTSPHTATVRSPMLKSCDGLRISPKWLEKAVNPSISMVVGIGGFVLACVALWATMNATGDGRKAEILAEWTAKKDFIEFCQTAGYESSACASARNMTLDPPPVFGKRGWRHPGNTDHGSKGANTNSAALLAVVLMCSLWVGCRAVVNLERHLRIRFARSVCNIHSHHKPDPLSPYKILMILLWGTPKKRPAGVRMIPHLEFPLDHGISLRTGVDLSPREPSTRRTKAAVKELPLFRKRAPFTTYAATGVLEDNRPGDIRICCICGHLF
ncbi:hypothetical protein QBC47DRAFT_53113 [Echria macrotheca]|uniref:Uncharacterized protein n=1 Tax=Echria macrotheca TaxID=438768 RepID=A0AAJ0B7J4_9PEZI|nr:hypothetical protein QBC47DRAFT_53113 [Echria macrotheca]